jgi:H+/Cl- antiporter ClcA
VTAPLKFLFGIVVVAAGVAVFAIGFRSSLTGLYGLFCTANNVVDAITSLPWWLRLTAPVAGAAIAGTIARFRTARSQGVSNVMEAIALGNIQLSMRSTASTWLRRGRRLPAAYR